MKRKQKSRRRRPPIELLTLAEAAETLRISPRTLQRLIGTGLPTVRIGRRTLIRLDDLQRLVTRSLRGARES
jgi:excisionase family DNA binding protein